MSKEQLPSPQSPLILRFHRLMDAFSKSDDERDFYLDRVEGFIIFIDLNKNIDDLDKAEQEVQTHKERYCPIPKMTYYETKKFMEGFVHEKVYDIDTKEKIFDIIQSKEAREHFLEFIYDHLTELEKWQQYYHERSRIRIIEWLRQLEIRFVFEEDLDLAKQEIEKVKHHFFDAKVSSDVQAARSVIAAKAKTYYSNEALNPRPKRGRPPKQAAKVELEPQYTFDMYKTVPAAVRPFLYLLDFTGTSVTFSAKFNTQEQFIASLRGSHVKVDDDLTRLSERLESLQQLSRRLRMSEDIEGIRDERIIQAVSGEDTKSPLKLTKLAKGLLPSRRKRSSQKTEIQEMIKKKREAGIKRVTPIQRKKRKK